MGGMPSRRLSEKKKREDPNYYVRNPNGHGGSPQKYFPEIMAKQIVEWVEDESAINLCQFCANHGYPRQKIATAEKNSTVFREALALAKMRLAERRERMLNTDLLHSQAYARYQSSYDPFLDKYENKQKDKDSRRKKEVAEVQVNAADMLKDLIANPEKYRQE